MARSKTTFQPGHKSTGGRHKGFAQAIRDALGDDPTKLALAALEIALGTARYPDTEIVRVEGGYEMVKVQRVPTFTHRLDAICFLRDTGWGKPAQVIAGDPENPLRVDSSDLLSKLQRLAEGSKP